tara:strand:+ start:669 stop:1049 length:381 start_codon:yes stop_codon:yes gene_type:complete
MGPLVVSPSGSSFSRPSAVAIGAASREEVELGLTATAEVTAPVRLEARALRAARAVAAASGTPSAVAVGLAVEAAEVEGAFLADIVMRTEAPGAELGAVAVVASVGVAAVAGVSVGVAARVVARSL